MHHLRFLTDDDVRQAVDMRRAIDLMRVAFAQLSNGGATVPVRTRVAMPEHDGRALFMPVYLPANEQVGIKVVMENGGNPQRGLPLIHALVTVYDAATGRPLAVMNGEYLTALRTGAASGLATDLLARGEASVLALFGVGVQACTQFEAVSAVRPIKRVLLFNRSRERAEAFAEAMRGQGAADIIRATASAQLREADIICTATTASTPVFKAQDVKPGAHINAIGAYRPDMAEVPPETVHAATVVVDQRAGCLAEAGDLIQPMRAGLIDETHIRAELGDIVARKQPGRVHEAEITLFKSVGNAVQDLAVATEVVTLAVAKGLGVQVAC